MLIKERKAAGMNQTELARALGQYQSFVARVKSDEKRVDAIEFLEITESIGSNPKALIGKLAAKKLPALADKVQRILDQKTIAQTTTSLKKLI